MWIHRKVALDQTYIYQSDRKNDGKQSLDTILAWAQKNPECTINLWFDSLLATNESVENTRACISQEIVKYKGEIAVIELQDTRQLDRVKKHPEIFSPEIPVYFRADLLRAIVAEELTKKNRDSYCVYVDFDLPTMNKIQLFDKKTLAVINQ